MVLQAMGLSWDDSYEKYSPPGYGTFKPPNSICKIVIRSRKDKLRKGIPLYPTVAGGGGVCLVGFFNFQYAESTIG